MSKVTKKKVSKSKKVSQSKLIKEIENESISLGRIDLDEFKKNPDIVKEVLNNKIAQMLQKFGYQYVISEFKWVNGAVTGHIDIVKTPEE